MEGYIVAVRGVTRAGGVHIMGEVRFANRITTGKLYSLHIATSAPEGIKGDLIRVLMI